MLRKPQARKSTRAWREREQPWGMPDTPATCSCAANQSDAQPHHGRVDKRDGHAVISGAGQAHMQASDDQQRTTAPGTTDRPPACLLRCRARAVRRTLRIATQTQHRPGVCHGYVPLSSDADDDGELRAIRPDYWL